MTHESDAMDEGQQAAVFREYAEFYDTLYIDKDYAAECRLIQSILTEHGVREGGSILDLGCGTGGHAIPLARAGYDVTGVDLSTEMIRIARDKIAEAGVPIQLLVGDARDFNAGRTFDAVIAMFAVVGYQLTNEDLSALFSVARSHLEPGGIFTFDAWFGPAVLSVRPERRSKVVRLDDGGNLTRTATPVVDVVAQTVRVDYELDRESADGAITRIQESHTVRFLFAQEVAYFLQVAGFEVVDLMPFMKPGLVPTAEDWNVTWTARAR